VFLPHSSLITWCWASSMRKAIRSSCFIFVDCAPVSMLALLAAVIVCRVGRYESGNDDMIRVLKQVLDRLDPILMRLS